MIKPFQIQIRFSDCDMLGHVNNACYLNYFESTRLHYFGQLLGLDWDWEENGIILRKNTIDYLLPLYLNDRARVTLLLKELGTKSFSLAYELSVNDQLKTTGESILVCYDFKKHQSKEIPAGLLSALTQLEKWKP